MKASQTLPDAARLREALRQVIDPEAGMNIVDLGLVYRIEVANGAVHIDLTMTSPACPLGEVILAEAEAAVQAVLPDDVKPELRLVWSPAWNPELMSEEAKLHFGW